jgi:hypothetical protein
LSARLRIGSVCIVSQLRSRAEVQTADQYIGILRIQIWEERPSSTAYFVERQEYRTIPMKPCIGHSYKYVPTNLGQIWSTFRLGKSLIPFRTGVLVVSRSGHVGSGIYRQLDSGLLIDCEHIAMVGTHLKADSSSGSFALVCASFAL